MHRRPKQQVKSEGRGYSRQAPEMESSTRYLACQERRQKIKNKILLQILKKDHSNLDGVEAKQSPNLESSLECHPTNFH